MSNNLVKLLATFFYCGCFPVAPGSMASLAGAFIAAIVSQQILLYILTFCVITALGFLSSGRMEKLTNQKDPSCVVIDEVAGSLIAFFMLPLSLPIWITAYFLFRAFDMFKIYPVNKLENLPGSAGIMMDDLVAGLYTNLVMQVAIRLTHMI